MSFSFRDMTMLLEVCEDRDPIRKVRVIMQAVPWSWSVVLIGFVSTIAGVTAEDRVS